MDGRKVLKKLPIKNFEIRDSLLTTLCENPHIKVVKHIFAASLIALFFNRVLHDYFEHGEVRIGFNVITAGMGKIHWVAFLWIILNFCAIILFYCFNFWADFRINHLPVKSKIQWDGIWLILLIGYYIAQFRVISIATSILKLPSGSASVICLEQTRILMKIHAFMRTNIEKVVKFKPHTETSLNLANLEHFLYFLFAPTLVYKDSYPRRKLIRWNFVFIKLIELIGVFFYYAFILEQFTIPDYQEIGLRSFTLKELILKAFGNFAIGLIFLLLSFYVVLDTTQNLFGELMKFGDRQFYKDWWTSTNYSDFFRNWNMVVGDWLYIYIYKDMYEYVVPGRKTVAKLAVFAISAIVHEWILTNMFGFFFPALFFAFGFTGGILSFVRGPKSSLGNIIFWYMLGLGSGLLTSLYAMEFFARNNVPIKNPTLRDLILPRIFTCNCIEY